MFSTRAFTLVELLIVAMISSVVVAAIASCVIGGVRTWDYARKFGGVEADALLKLETVQRDAANTFYFYAIAFNGDSAGMTFPALVDVTTDGSGELRPGAIKYYFDPDKKALYRKAWQFPVTEPSDDKAERILTGLSGFDIQYYSLPSSGDSSSEWQKGWNNFTNFPGAVMMNLLFDGDKQQIKISRTIMLPAGASKVEQGQQSPPRSTAK